MSAVRRDSPRANCSSARFVYVARPKAIATIVTADATEAMRNDRRTVSADADGVLEPRSERQRHRAKAVGWIVHVRHVGGEVFFEREDVVRAYDRATAQLGSQQREHGKVEVLPAVEQHEVDGRGEVGEGLERVALANLHVVGEPGIRQVAARRADLVRYDFRADETSV